MCFIVIHVNQIPTVYKQHLTFGAVFTNGKLVPKRVELLNILQKELVVGLIVLSKNLLILSMNTCYHSTPQRLDIIELFYKNGHLTEEQLFTKLQCIHQNISLATIYKNIKCFLCADLLLEVKLNEQKIYYELTKKSHSHLFCIRCLILQDLIIPGNSLDKELNKISKFNIDMVDVTFYGLCDKCQ